MNPLDLLAALGAHVVRLMTSLGHASAFFVELVRHTPAAVRRFDLSLVQIYAIGNLSLVIIVTSGASVGGVLALQAYYALDRYGAAESVGLLVALSLLRELGPVLTALLYAGRAGTSLTAEIGLMKAGEQLAAMEMMAVDPRSRVLAPRFLAGIISMPLLSAIFSAVGVGGAYVIAVKLIGIDSAAFWSQMQDGVDVFKDVGNGVVKTIVFGVASTFVALYMGYESDATPEGVARATTRTVVFSSVSVLILDFLLTSLMFSVKP
ncbi:MAG TPA: lipid asymmetry maintenance ABC transporter permease subunit MlaE [Burkholderiaceae bacterium]|nr:lipid asymmetry maintenance ABC transporter permease subunit MlaE [Burkholderiaceae bacterium]